ncbi:MAG: glutaminyl-peptide cyclotransferase [Candidatus Bathyarchaeota archaeon]|nr:glutaminyl-peptide cyclotransferase [Candidatus Bathyarchaeota archaeon]
MIILVAAGIGLAYAASLIWTAVPDGPTQYTYTVINTYPHDTAAYTQGLLIDDGVLYESTGGFGASTLRRVDLTSGSVQQQIKLNDYLFGEGLTLVNGKLLQLTWQNRIGFIYDKETLMVQGNFSYPTEGWGLTYDGTSLIMSDGTSNLYFLDPATFQQTRQISVQVNGTALTNINELEYVNGEVYANIWHTQTIAIINSDTGEVRGYLDLSGLYQQQSLDDVLNGIAYDQESGRLFVTGKNWASLFEIEIVPK